MTYRELCRRLSAAGIENETWDAACLLLHFCKADLLSLRTDPDRDYDSPDLDAAVQRRISHEPLQYILGSWDFYRQTYLVSPHCLIPRSDTEILVEQAIRRLPHGAYFADLCTGSGCIAISTLAERPDTSAVAVEKYPETLEMAIKNAALNEVSDRFSPCLADVLTPPECKDEIFDAILSNPPYIATHVLETLSPEVKREPIAALDGGEDGLLFYRAILKNWSRTLKKNGMILFEIGYDQREALIKLGEDFGFSEIEVLRDLGGNDRVVIFSKNSQKGSDLS